MSKIAKSSTQLANCILLHAYSCTAVRAQTKTSLNLFDELA